MRIEKEVINDETIIVVPGEEIEVYNASDLKDELAELVEKGVINIIIDLQNVEYIDSSGLGVFVSTLKKVKIKNGKMIFTSPKSSIKQILELTSLDKVFTIATNREEALDMFKA